MSKFSSKNRWFIVISILIALMLNILPLPTWIAWLRPQWVFLVLMYWVIMIPGVIGIFAVFGIGIIIDLLNNSLLGLHAFPLILIAYILYKLHRQVRQFSLPQQSLVMLGMVFLYQFIIYVLQNIFGLALNSHLYWASIVTSAILWPWIWIVLRDYQHRHEIR